MGEMLTGVGGERNRGVRAVPGPAPERTSRPRAGKKTQRTSTRDKTVTILLFVVAAIAALMGLGLFVAAPSPIQQMTGIQLLQIAMLAWCFGLVLRHLGRISSDLRERSEGPSPDVVSGD